MDHITRIANRRFKANRLRNSFADAFHLIEANKSDADILSALEINIKCLSKAKAAYVGLFPDKADNVTDVFDCDKKYLIDECLPPVCVLSVTKYYGLAAHIDHLDMTGTKDPELYRWAVEQGYAAIFSADVAFRLKGRKNPFRSRDLTGVATAFAIEAVFDEITKSQFLTPKDKLPVVIRFSNRPKNNEEMERLLLKHSRKIEFSLRRKISPYITVSEQGVTLGPSYKNIFDEFMMPNNKQISREMRWKEGWVKRIKAKYGGKKLSRKRIKRIEEMAEANARECLAVRGMRYPHLVAA